MGDNSCGNFSINNQTLSQQDFDSNNHDVIIEYGFKTSTISPNVKIQVTLRIWMGIFKRVMVMLLVDMFFKTATQFLSVRIKRPLRRWVGILKRVMVM